GVRNIAKLVTAGDVSGLHQRCGIQVHDFPFRGHVHYRLVLDTWGTPVSKFTSTYEMVTAIHAALIAHHDAVKECSVLHRDVSVANILIVRDGDKSGGILIDWELSQVIGVHGNLCQSDF
ncbi:hypothetical protein MPER_14878, partial [Moniliophthora perniciosa FA553]